jgi:NADH-quinone oxidoreductase subunit A
VHQIATQSLTIPANEAPPSVENLIALAVYTGMVLFLVALLMAVAYWLGRKTQNTVKGQPFESGIEPTGQARLHEPVPFYLVAIFFTIFDVETLFIVSWAVAYDHLGWAGFAQMAVFIGVLFVALIYLWKVGALNWGPRAARPPGRRDPGECE